MCGTLSRSITPQQIISAFNIEQVNGTLPPSYNIKPTLPVLFIREKEGKKLLDIGHWWLTPPWIKNDIQFRNTDEGMKSYRWKGKPISMFNLRLDTLTDPKKPTWKKYLSQQRCAIIADAFVEWPDDTLRDKTKPKIPALFYYKSHEPFGILGLWDCIQDDEGKDFLSCCVITVSPNKTLQGLPHHRMPAMLRGKELDNWLSEDLTDPFEAAKLCHPTEDMEMGFHFISQEINYGRNNFPEMLNPISPDSVLLVEKKSGIKREHAKGQRQQREPNQEIDLFDSLPDL